MQLIMGTIGFLFLVICLWFFYNFIVKVVLPVYNTANRLKKQFKNMTGQQPFNENSASATSSVTPTQKVGEYVDFEEIK